MPHPLRPFRHFAAVALFAACLVASDRAVAGEHSIGLGVNYWKTVDDLDLGDDIDDDGLAEVLSYRYSPGGLVSFEFDLEHFGDGFAGATKDAYSPQAYIVVGRHFYGAVGVGTTYSSDLDDEITDPFYAAKLGLNMALLPHLDLDLSANYRFDAWKDLDQADTDTVFLGAMIRFGF
jgi:hypothetical protein